MNFNTPFGQSTDTPGKLAPTKKQVADNPGAYADTSFDPIAQLIPSRSFRNFSFLTEDELDALPAYAEFALWFKEDRGGAQIWFFNTHEGNYLNLKALTPEQKTKLGVK